MCCVSCWNNKKIVEGIFCKKGINRVINRSIECVEEGGGGGKNRRQFSNILVIKSCNWNSRVHGTFVGTVVSMVSFVGSKKEWCDQGMKDRILQHKRTKTTQP